MFLIKNFLLYVVFFPAIMVITPIIDLIVYIVLGIIGGVCEAFSETKDTYSTILAEYKDRWGF